MKTLITYLSFFIALIIREIPGWAQLSNITWQKTFGGDGNEIIQDISPTSDGNFIVLGIADDKSGDVDCDLKGRHDTWVIKMDGASGIIWQRSFGGSKEEANPYSKIIQTKDGGYLLMMECWSNDFDGIGTHGLSDVLVIRLDNEGNKIWSRCYGGSKYENPRWIVELPGERFLLLMRATSSDGDVPVNIDSSERDAWMVIIDDAGNILTNKIYGGTGVDDLYCAARTTNGQFVLVGNTTSTDGDLEGQPVQSSDAWLLVTDPEGNILQNHVYGESGDDVFMQVIPTKKEGYMIFGESDDTLMPLQKGSHHGETDMWMLKVNFDGKVVWQGMYGGSKGEHVSRVVKATDGSYYLAGGSYSSDGDVTSNDPESRNCCVIQISLSGDVISSVEVGGTGTESFNSVALAPNGVIGAGFTYSHDGDPTDVNGTADGWVVKLGGPVPQLRVQSESKMVIFPNPAVDEVKISLPDFEHEEDLRIRISDMMVHQYFTESFRSEFSFQLRSGIYLVQVIDNCGEIASEEKLIVSGK